MESVTKENDQKCKEVLVVEEDHRGKVSKSRNLELDLNVATKELDAASSSKHPHHKNNRVFSCKYCGKEFSSIQALGGLHNAHRPPERGPMRMYLGLPYHRHLMHPSSPVSSSGTFSQSPTELGRIYEMLKMNSSMAKMSCTPLSTLRHRRRSQVGAWPSHSSSSVSLLQNNIGISSQLPINNININITGINSNFGENIGGRVSPTIATTGIPLNTNSNGDQNILKSTGDLVAEPRRNMQEAEQGLDLTLKL